MKYMLVYIPEIPFNKDQTLEFKCFKKDSSIEKSHNFQLCKIFPKSSLTIETSPPPLPSASTTTECCASSDGILAIRDLV